MTCVTNSFEPYFLAIDNAYGMAAYEDSEKSVGTTMFLKKACALASALSNRFPPERRAAPPR